MKKPKNTPLPLQEQLHQLFDYDADAGVLVWREGTWRGHPAGYNRERCSTIVIDKHQYLAHRIVWMHQTGEDPGDMTIDHIDHNPHNNRMDNLRVATQIQQNQNIRGYGKYLKGVQYDNSNSTNRQRWIARIGLNGKSVYLGRYDTEALAHQAYVEAAIVEYGEYACLG